ncbi:hypothetical protein ONZ43_g3982 [Nemania bipapillata]|uniref:Uncharacterized protein n=1 Tax=Nemania bipapillata TaxID=110536 RepID=A0ACC2ITJ9_9PEZI|nr:hypothetical protein ONZ43_g3982 [Nemania bipapillata]
MIPPTPLLLLLAAIVCSVRAVENWPILAPLAGENVPANQTYTIKWTAQTEGPVSITLMYTDADQIILTPSTENTGSYEWIPVSVLAGNADYFLKICDVNLDGSECAYTSDGRFHIVQSSTTPTTSTINPTSTTTTSTIDTTSTTPSSTSSSTSKTPITTSTTTTPPSTETTRMTTTPTPSEDNGNKESSGLGTASTVGLSVGTTLGTLALAAVIFIFYKKFKKGKASTPGSGPGPHGAGAHPSAYYYPDAPRVGMGEYSQPQHNQQYPIQGHPVQQKQHPPSELDSQTVVHELGDYRR